MPFLWGKVAGEGWILGDSAAGSVVRVTNGKRFSYPGYNELLTGSRAGGGGVGQNLDGWTDRE